MRGYFGQPSSALGKTKRVASHTTPLRCHPLHGSQLARFGQALSGLSPRAISTSKTNSSTVTWTSSLQSPAQHGAVWAAKGTTRSQGIIATTITARNRRAIERKNSPGQFPAQTDHPLPAGGDSECVEERGERLERGNVDRAQAGGARTGDVVLSVVADVRRFGLDDIELREGDAKDSRIGF